MKISDSKQVGFGREVKSQRGFSLLEAMVALTLLATTGVAIFSWFSVTYDGLIRLQDVQARHQLMQDLHAYFSTVNLQRESNQQLHINGFDVVWRAELVEPKQIGRSELGSESNFDLGLYDIDIEINRDGRLIGEYETRLVGYEKVRDISNER